jgi:hypothetical protein
MRLSHFYFTLIAVSLISCDTYDSIPDPFEGRYYGYDTVITFDQPYNSLDTIVHKIYLDVQGLRPNEYDVYNNDGFWVREGTIFQNQLDINIEPFKGIMRLTFDSLSFNASAISQGYTITHKAYLNR